MEVNVNINELYGALFETIRALREGKIELSQAKVINESAQVMVNLAKAETDFLKFAKQNESRFLNPDGYYKSLDETLNEIKQKNSEPLQLMDSKLQTTKTNKNDK